MKGAVASGKQVIADVGGNLAIESLQDVSTYDSQQHSGGASVSLCIPPFCYGASSSGSVSASQSKVNSNFASVSEQSGIKAGDGGFQVGVAGNTNLNGGVIASTQTAVEQGRNSFSTGGSLALADILNKADYQGESVSVNVGTAASLDGKLVPAGTSAGFGTDSGSAVSTTKAGISGIAGNSAVRTGDKETGIQKIFDADAVQKEINAQTQITQLFGQQAGKAVGDYAQAQRKALQEQLKNAAMEDDKLAIEFKIREVNNEERVMNVLIGAVTGMGGTALAKETLSAAAEEMRRLTIENSSLSKGVTDGTTVLTNISGVSDGVRGDGTKGGGTRIDLDNICGPANERCVTTKDQSGKEVLDLKDGMVQWNKEGAKGLTLAEYLDSPEGQKAARATGGIQAMLKT